MDYQTPYYGAGSVATKVRAPCSESSEHVGLAEASQGVLNELQKNLSR